MQIRQSEVDFFRSIGRLPVSALKELWYTDQEGNISKCSTHIRCGEDTWRKNYWNNFYRDITIKTGDWAYEQEYRLILEDGLSEFDNKTNRTLTFNYQFVERHYLWN